MNGQAGWIGPVATAVVLLVGAITAWLVTRQKEINRAKAEDRTAKQVDSDARVADLKEQMAALTASFEKRIESLEKEVKALRAIIEANTKERMEELRRRVLETAAAGRVTEAKVVATQHDVTEILKVTPPLLSESAMFKTEDLKQPPQQTE